MTRDGRAMAAFEPCGCTAWISVFGYDDAGLYREAAKHVKAGFDVHEVIVEEWKAKSLWCDLHPTGPPWWKVHGGNGKRPAEMSAQMGLAL